ncbi:flagellar basal body P-ring formation protein FlgA, partial [Enterobacter cloacae]
FSSQLKSHPVTPIDGISAKCVAIYSVDAKPLQVESSQFG